MGTPARRPGTSTPPVHWPHRAPGARQDQLSSWLRPRLDLVPASAQEPPDDPEQWRSDAWARYAGRPGPIRHKPHRAPRNHVVPLVRPVRPPPPPPTIDPSPDAPAVDPSAPPPAPAEP